ncbi:hypothetical protein NECAME_16966 [Necator americanus]|uniref:SXP/RAL-2 family protein Ani s 5-like cation-binding domain-containing protein n=1 Tax=Necator americanus TaxID=51031 RepID=W2TV17_NECAM|nr:hypothetical protein NECAME_16966 [Necator americanus]ETN84882.1 hypothetical protein NECAME_16966 [Necator americanus]
MEFKKIIRDQKMTKGDREIALDDWADKHGLTKEYQKYKNATKTAREETRKSIKEALRNVQQFFEELEKIEDNQNQTYKEEKDQIRETCQALDSRGRRLVNCISNLYTVPVSYSGKQRRFSLFEDLFLDEPFLLSNPASKLKSLFSW